MKRVEHPDDSLLLAAAAALFFVAAFGTVQAASPEEAVEAGQREFQENCAVCHGADGKGTGPLAAELKKGAPDLTLIAENNGGVFPFLRIIETIDGRADVLSHGSKEMPVWGTTFREEGNPTLTHGRMLDLTLYLESIQAR